MKRVLVTAIALALSAAAFGDGKSPKSQLLPQGVGGYVIEGRSRVLDDGEVVHAADE